jgi:hypothetical protein
MMIKKYPASLQHWNCNVHLPLHVEYKNQQIICRIASSAILEHWITMCYRLSSEESTRAILASILQS